MFSDLDEDNGVYIGSLLPSYLGLPLSVGNASYGLWDLIEHMEKMLKI